MIDLRGLGTALITPFNVNGQIDFTALGRLIDLQIEGGIDYLVVLGTTGEAATLTPSERQQVIDFVIQKVERQIRLVLGLGGNNTAAVIDQLKALTEEQRAAFSAILSVCPYYNKPSQEGLYRHFAAIAEASPLPIVLYNVPGRTGVNLLPETVIRLAHDYPNQIIGIKEASGNLEQITELILRTSLPLTANRSPFTVISGDDGIAVELLHRGAEGLISVLSNAFPKETAKMVHEQDDELLERFQPLISLLFKEGNPAGVKTVLAQQGLIQNILRLPLVPNSQAVQDEIAETLKKL
ncbi:MAG: 4-hydroxy-tetrahydrodipicolinate synthase [Paludibacteraceae bacterium]|nr:4-hydroxy-tetrahydrodipicolinate synthase [Paludibacteraceae bacterium]